MKNIFYTLNIRITRELRKNFEIEILNSKKEIIIAKIKKEYSDDERVVALEKLRELSKDGFVRCELMIAKRHYPNDPLILNKVLGQYEEKIYEEVKFEYNEEKVEYIKNLDINDRKYDSVKKCWLVNSKKVEEVKQALAKIDEKQKDEFVEVTFKYNVKKVATIKELTISSERKYDSVKKSWLIKKAKVAKILAAFERIDNE